MNPTQVSGSPRFVLVLNGMQDMVELFRVYLEQDGWVVISATVDEARRAELDLAALVGAHDPAVVVYDVPPPYDVNWRYVGALRDGILKDRPIVITTTNERRLREFVATTEPVIEVFGKPYDMKQVVAAVRRAAAG